MEESKQPERALPEGWRPLSDKEIHVFEGPQGQVIRMDGQGRTLCRATRRDGELCKSPAVHGMKVCRMHGAGHPGAKQKARLKLIELIDPAIATLAREMMNADKSADRQRAANSILDRAGMPRVSTVTTEDAKTILYQRLLAMQNADGEQYVESDYLEIKSQEKEQGDE